MDKLKQLGVELYIKNDDVYQDEVHVMEIGTGGCQGWHKPLSKFLNDIENGSVEITDNNIAIEMKHNLHIKTNDENYYVQIK